MKSHSVWNIVHNCHVNTGLISLLISTFDSRLTCESMLSENREAQCSVYTSHKLVISVGSSIPQCTQGGHVNFQVLQMRITAPYCLLLSCNWFVGCMSWLISTHCLSVVLGNMKAISAPTVPGKPHLVGMPLNEQAQCHSNSSQQQYEPIRQSFYFVQPAPLLTLRNLFKWFPAVLSTWYNNHYTEVSLQLATHI